MNCIEEKVHSFIEENNMLEKVNKVYVATSGGADSMALLAFMHKYQTKLGIDVAAVHVNHGIRGETARRDANFVSNYCAKNNIEYKLFDAEADNIEVPSDASEEWARQLRYNYFSKVLEPGVCIATAHTLSDQLETVIFRMARGGSGLNGMCGIPVIRDQYIRPFLCINRTEVEKLVELYGTSNITDETNLGDAYSRNKIRHTVVPVLKQINPNAEQSVGKLCNRMSKAYKFIHRYASDMIAEATIIPNIKYDTVKFAEQDDAVLEEMLLQILTDAGDKTEQYIEVLKSYISKQNINSENEELLGALQFNSENTITVTNKYITISSKASWKDCNVGTIVFDELGYSIEVAEVSKEEYMEAGKDKRNLCLFAGSKSFNPSLCTIRNKHSGDRFKPAKRMGGKLVKYLRNIPLAERNSVPLIEYNGKVIWLWGLGFTDDMLPNSKRLDAEKIYKVTWHNN